jgi:hypothetical protein
VFIYVGLYHNSPTDLKKKYIFIFNYTLHGLGGGGPFTYNFHETPVNILATLESFLKGILPNSAKRVSCTLYLCDFLFISELAANLRHFEHG